ncbi:hypothetical protein FQA39_LY14080 [Lamprigera yunnana]|nr:hypothetical protein FQA39_LY14080 [Lamprigera yunnana]
MEVHLLLSLLLTVLVYGHRHHGHNDQHGHHEDHIGFYWDDYNENTIKHAVQGGKDTHDKITYIGQAKHDCNGKQCVLPGIVYPDVNLMVYEWDKKPQRLNSNFKILCTHYPDHMKWIKTNTDDIKKLIHEKELIPGGIDENLNKIYIGRVQTDGGLLVGKVITTDDAAGFYAVAHVGYVHENNFEVLAHVMQH